MNEGELPAEAGPDWRTPDQRAEDIAQARELRQQASAGGLRFEVFLPSGLAEWVLDLVAQGVFTDPGEAVKVLKDDKRAIFTAASKASQAANWLQTIATAKAP